jgi:hypothetical protein
MVYLLKARIEEPEETHVAREQHGRMHATIEELFKECILSCVYRYIYVKHNNQ